MLLSWTTGSTIDAHEGVNQYVKVRRWADMAQVLPLEQHRQVR
jgi:hypothetical protein